ncbi:MAG: hypothetical protein RIT81_39055 [Deltaproteobacteria bacterium]
MTLRFFNGLQIDVPKGWTDLSTVIIAPKKDVAKGDRPSINLVVKRRPAKKKEDADTLKSYLSFMRQSFGELHDLETKDLLVGNTRAKAVRFKAYADGRCFTQTTMLYTSAGDEISATVTQLDEDPTTAKEVEKLLKSIRPAAGGLFGIK